ncbi:hypothetical protein SAMD00020551_2030 [Mesobacillus selenatarsenatis SF-1]|uniref:Uncharacterized protein n=1 Tax=Mesobacillus selenatarsenatis (strain DSM 18680 / JCM 14380 / FERM P-15431 / SF-1) TaxID=1321606 RepID=A0A0A8X1U4_MESS1|nr:hypothetical protein SAMD00020551_2030 [Mesobacillus selenatarsenatis SF-1]
MKKPALGLFHNSSRGKRSILEWKSTGHFNKGHLLSSFSFLNHNIITPWTSS